jgi:glycosyltransferase involved in cell wall biosynthesis
VSLEGWRPFVGPTTFDQELAALPIAPELKARIHPSGDLQAVTARVAYMTFLRMAELSLPWLEERQLPFILQLYPGGAFQLHQPRSDEVLRRVIASPLLRRIIVTQQPTRAYLLEQLGCQPERIEHIYGGVFESRGGFDLLRDKRLYPRDKETLDVCFVAHRYADNLTAKGYDLFVAVARGLVEAGHANVRFHVVGDYRADHIPLGRIADRFSFHGVQPSEFFEGFYAGMDLIVSLNRPFDIRPGVFDGFPTGACIEAGLHGVVNCINDPLDSNPGLVDGRDLILLDFDIDRAVGILDDLLAHPSRLYQIAYTGWRRYHVLFDTDRQLWARSKVILDALREAD